MYSHKLHFVTPTTNVLTSENGTQPANGRGRRLDQRYNIDISLASYTDTSDSTYYESKFCPPCFHAWKSQFFFAS
jgi:hypothetical protein